jgi:sulfur-oxidizing protein SoxY
MALNEREALSIERRRLMMAAGTMLVSAFIPRAARAQAASQAYVTAREALTRGREVRSGRVLLDIPRLAESGNSVSLKVVVVSPMTAVDHVSAIHILSEANPLALVATFRLGPRSGRAEVATNIRLATTQIVHAIAEMSDGTLWEASTEVVVLLAACLDGA